MNKISVVAVSLAVVFSGCSSTNNKGDIYERRAAAEIAQRTKDVERAMAKIPSWMIKVPESTEAVYASGTAVSSDMAMAAEKARLIALAKICVSAGGTMEQESRVYQSDTETSSTERSEMAIQSRCRSIDVTGSEVREMLYTPEGTRFRAYVLMALPTSPVNPLITARDRGRVRAETEQRAKEAFERINQDRKE